MNKREPQERAQSRTDSSASFRRCICHRVDEHRCPALTKLRNFAIMTGRCHLENGRLVPGSWVPVQQSTHVQRKGRH